MQSTTPRGVTQVQRNKPSRNIAARAGRWSAQNRKKAIFGWLAFVLIALVAGQAVGMNSVSQNSGPGESGRAGAAIERAFPKNDQGASEQVLVQKKGNVSDAQFRSTVNEVATKLERTQYVKNVTSALDRGNRGQLSPDGKSALVNFDVTGDQQTMEDHVVAPLATVAAVQKSHPELRVEEFGDASVGKALSETEGKDFQRAETLSLP